MNIRRTDEIDDRTGEFINKAFTDYAISRAVELNFDEYCIVAENDDGQVIGAITGRAYYNESEQSSSELLKTHTEARVTRRSLLPLSDSRRRTFIKNSAIRWNS